eukprot:TRINITY_DN34614_c0_g1_i1.p1 TRINITY_DN34614_c0_g1~~TRINITY_DN34614_c0_g1_i1.p1  ORF type:complete len:215 (-),score=17.08 TRINITY_DN34614_c0_g1_i1:19-663(-)
MTVDCASRAATNLRIATHTLTAMRPFLATRVAPELAPATGYSRLFGSRRLSKARRTSSIAFFVIAALLFLVATPCVMSARTALLGIRQKKAAIRDALGAALRTAIPARGSAHSEPHLVGFYAEQSLEAKRMRYLGGLLEKEIPAIKIVWLETWENPLNERLRAIIDLRNQCGGVPYLFNRKTGKVLCGVVAYDKLRRWAQGLGGDARIYRDIGR